MIALSSNLPRAGAALALALTLSACAGQQAAVPTAAPPTAPAATEPAIVEPTSPPATQLPAATEPAIVEPTAAPAVPTVTGQLVLDLGPDEVGLGRDEFGGLVGPPSLRIGVDGSVRLLDAINRRVLFYTTAGQLARSLNVSAAVNPLDFIVNNQGEVFVYDYGQRRDDGQGRTGQRVLRYGPDGAVRAEIPISDEISGNGLMLTADQHLVLAFDNYLTYLLLRNGEPVPPDFQVATRQQGAVTPRSPVLFRVQQYNGNSNLDLDSVYSGRPVNNDLRSLAVPAEDASFFNVDRAMNLYFTSPLNAGLPELTVRRLLPDGSLAGAARIDIAGCSGSNWRSFYIDQEGAAWTLCTSEAGVSVSRYDLLDQSGAPLPLAAAEPADVPWRPGATQNPAA